MLSIIAKIKRQKEILYTNVLWRRRFYKTGKRVVVNRPLSLNNPSCISIGDYTIINAGSILADLDLKNSNYPKIKIGDYCTFFYRFQCNSAVSVTIGNYVGIAANVLISDSDHIIEKNGLPITKSGKYISKPVVIGNNCWIGQNAVILKGVTIGDNCIIGANCVVTKDVPSNSVMVGNPGKVIRTIGQE